MYSWLLLDGIQITLRMHLPFNLVSLTLTNCLNLEQNILYKSSYNLDECCVLDSSNLSVLQILCRNVSANFL